MFFCNDCNLKFEDLNLYLNHLKEEHHRNNSDVDSYLDDFSSNFSCSICKVKCSGSVPFEEHLISKNHKRKVKELELVNQCNQLMNSEMSAVESSSRDASLSNNNNNNNTGYEFKSKERNDEINSLNDSIDFPFSCATCDRRFSGIVPYNQHLLSKKHEKKLKESELIKQIQMNKSATEDIVIVSEKEILNEFNKFSVIDDTVESLSCTICKVSFTGIESYNSHMIGKKHERKIKELKAFERLQQTGNIECDLNISIKCNGDITRNILEACNEEARDFNSEQNSDTNNLSSNLKYDSIVYEEQIIANEKYKERELENMGEKFFKNETNMLTEPAINNEKIQINVNKSNNKLTNSLENMPDNLQNHSYQCDVCGINLSGIIPYNQHLKGNKHKKEKMKAEYVKLQSLNTVNSDDENISFEYQKREKEFQISNTSSKTNQTNISLSSINSTASYIASIDSCKNNSLFCKICNVACSGIIPYKQHIDSEKHLKKQLIYEKLNSQFNESKDLKLQDLNITSYSNIPEEEKLKMNVFKLEYSDNDKTQLEKSEDLALHDMKCLICNEIFRERESFEEHKNNCKCLSEKKLNNMTNQIAVIKDRNNQLKENTSEESPKASSSKANFNNYLYSGLSACSKTVERQSNNENQSATSLQILTCKFCSTTFTGHIPFEQHLKSLKHKKKVEKLNITISRENVSKSEEFSSQNIIEQNVNEEEYDTKSANCVNKFEYKFPHLDIKQSNVNNESYVMQESDQFSMISSTSSIEVLEKF